MNLLKLSIRRPVAVAMLYLVIAALGFYFLNKLPLEQLPTNIRLPSLTVRADWPYTSPETMEAFVTSPIEAVSNTIKGVKEVSSTSYEGRSDVTIEFVKNTDIDFAEMELKEKLSILEDDLPANVRKPLTITSSTPSSMMFGNLGRPQPMQYTLTGSYTLQWLRKYALDELDVPLKSVDGVGDVTILGGQDRLVKIAVDRQKAEMYGISESQVTNAINSIEVKKGAGYLHRGGSRYDVFVDNTVSSVDDIRNLVLKKDDNKLVRITDIADVFDTFEEPNSYSRINGNPNIRIIINQEEGINTITFVKKLEAKVAELKSEFPPHLQMIKTSDPSIRINRELTNIKVRAVFCILVIFAVLYIFLRNIRVPLLILSTVLFSELMTVILFYAFDVSFNILTIAGLALGFGMLVDSAIVVIDNIFRYREKGEKSFQAAAKGAKEVFMPILASVFTTSIVFIPFLYLTGDNRILFIPLALAVALSLISSIAVAFTFIPTFALKIIPDKAVSIQDKMKKNRILYYITHFYSLFIEFVIRKKYWTIATVLLIFAGSAILFNYTVPTFSFGRSNQDTRIDVYVGLPTGAELDEADKIAVKLEDRILGREHVQKVSTEVRSSSRGTYLYISIEFTDEGEQTIVPMVLKDDLTAYGATFAGVAISIRGVGDYFSAGGFGGSGYNFGFQILGYNYNEVGKIAEDIGRKLKRITRVKNVETNSSGRYGRNRDQYESVLKIKREELAAYDLDVSRVIANINKYLRGSYRSQRIKIKGEDVTFSIKAKNHEYFQMAELGSIPITTGSGEQVRLGTVAEIIEQKIMSRIERKDQQYIRNVTFEYRGPAQLGKRIVDTIVENTVLPNGYTIKSDSGFNFGRREKTELWLVIVFAMALVYMITSSLYESLLHPFVIILTVPMALIGVFLIFFFMGKSFNQTAYIGIILLAGIVVNNSIILVDHINLLRRKGMELYPAVIQGCQDRIRPILMTSATTIMGMLPLIAFSSKTNAFNESIWYSLSLASIGGLLSATPLTLSVIPVLYILFEEWRYGLRKFWNKHSVYETGASPEPAPVESE